MSLFSLPLESVIITSLWHLPLNEVLQIVTLPLDAFYRPQLNVVKKSTEFFAPTWYCTYCSCFYPLSMIAVAHKSDEGSTGVTNPSGIREAPGKVSWTKKASHCRLEEGNHSSLLKHALCIRIKQNKNKNLHVRLASQFLLSTLSTTCMVRHPAYNSITEFMITYRLNFLALSLAKSSNIIMLALFIFSKTLKMTDKYLTIIPRARMGPE